jgi:GDPmannose 4,6-dehydratase
LGDRNLADQAWQEPTRQRVSFFACRHFGASRELDAMSRLAPITGMTGQDGPYLPELLLARAYEVHGSKRRGDPTLLLHYGDVTEPSNVIKITQQVQPNEIYNLCCSEPFPGQLRYARIHRQGRCVGSSAAARGYSHLETRESIGFYQAPTSERFGNAPPPQAESTLPPATITLSEQSSE